MLGGSSSERLRFGVNAGRYQLCRLPQLRLMCVLAVRSGQAHTSPSICVHRGARERRRGRVFRKMSRER
eukprot:15057764-Alexandrium_andersonii.AAC.1